MLKNGPSAPFYKLSLELCGGIYGKGHFLIIGVGTENHGINPSSLKIRGTGFQGVCEILSGYLSFNGSITATLERVQELIESLEKDKGWYKKELFMGEVSEADGSSN